MTALELIGSPYRYSDWATREVLAAASRLPDAELDQTFEMGPGTLRRTLQHIHHFEAVYLERWQNRGPATWPAYDDAVSVAEVTRRFATTWATRDAYLARVDDGDLGREIRWQDSRGGWYRAPLSEALVQVCNHSSHHRAQAVNMLRRLTAALVEIDYMMHVRRPAD